MFLFMGGLKINKRCAMLISNLKKVILINEWKEWILFLPFVFFDKIINDRFFYYRIIPSCCRGFLDRLTLYCALFSLA